MSGLLTATQMRALEAAAMAAGEASGLELMERAGRGVVAAVLTEWPELAAGSAHAVVLCGPGNNGGDGYVIARLLDDAGWRVAVHALTAPGTEDAATMAARWRGGVSGLSALRREDLADRPLVVDALFGTGLTRPISPAVGGALRMARAAGCRIVAVDVPSGLCADSGRYLAEDAAQGWQADLTVTFESAKLGHMLADGPGMCGRLAVVPLGLNRGLRDLARTAGAVQRASVPARDLIKAGGHKFCHGHALILSGRSGQGGAARMAARGALRIGAGLVTLGCPAEAVPENAARLDAVMLKAVEDANALAEVLKDPRINALCLGPGLGLDGRAAGLLGVALGWRGEPRRGLVVDADALTLLSRDPALFAMLHPGCVLTPHAGEFARLFPDIAARLDAPAKMGPAYSKVDAAREAARRAGCVVLFKGADTVIAAPDDTCAISAAVYDRAAPWLATAGSGDVLAGFITGLLARGFAPQQAAESAAWLHVECARSFGPGLIAEDLPEELPGVFRALQGGSAQATTGSASQASSRPPT